MDNYNGNLMFSLAEELFPINRSITGPGVRETLRYIKKYLPQLTIKYIKSGSKSFDWEIPKEWIIKEAYLLDENGNKIVDFKNCNDILVTKNKFTCKKH